MLKVYNYKDQGGGIGLDRFVNLPKESIDVIFYGTSHTHCSIDTGILWDEYGIAAVNLTAGSQPIRSTRDFIEYSLQYQSPQVIAVDIYGLLQDDGESVVDLYRNLLGMQLSPLYARKSFEYADTYGNDNGDIKNKLFEYISRFPLVHSRYSNISQEDFELKLPYMMGYRGSFECYSFEKPTLAAEMEELPISDTSIETVNQIVDIATQNNTNVVFFAAPYILDYESSMKFNYFAEYCKSKGWSFIDFNRIADDINIDYATDFRDTDHLNNFGAAKLTGFLGSYLSDNYDFISHDGDEKYNLWNENSLYLQDRQLRYLLSRHDNINDYLLELAKDHDNYLVGILCVGNYNYIPDTYDEGMRVLNISEEEYNSGGLLLIDQGKRTITEPGEYSVCYPTINNREIHVDSKLNRIVVDNFIYDYPDNSIVIFVYDTKIDYLVDVAYCDIYSTGLMINHIELQY